MNMEWKEYFLNLPDKQVLSCGSMGNRKQNNEARVTQISIIINDGTDTVPMHEMIVTLKKALFKYSV